MRCGTYPYPNECEVYHPHCRLTKYVHVFYVVLKVRKSSTLLFKSIFFTKKNEVKRHDMKIENRILSCCCFVDKHTPKIHKVLVNRMFLDEILDDICISSTCGFVTPSDCCRFGSLETLTQKKVVM